MYQYNIKRKKGKEDNQVREKCADIRRKVKETKCRPDIHDYPSVIVGCYTNYDRLYIDTTHSKPQYIQAPLLHKALSELGPIGSRKGLCDFIIGACAEPKAAFFAMTEEKCNLTQLQYTTAFRPRTGEKKKYCKNCKKVFSI